MSLFAIANRVLGAPRRIHPLDAFLAHWLTVGALVLLALPSAHWHNTWVGWLPFWLVLVPALPLARHGLRAKPRVRR